MSISIGSKLVGTDVSFYTHPLAQVSVGPVVVWENGGGALLATVRLEEGGSYEGRVDAMVTSYNGEEFEVRWGDGEVSTQADVQPGLKNGIHDGIRHTYDQLGTYTIEIRGGCKVSSVSGNYYCLLDFYGQLLELKVKGKCPIRQWSSNVLGFRTRDGKREVAVPEGLFNGIGKLETSLNCSNLFENYGNNDTVWGGDVPGGLFAGLPSNVSKVNCDGMFYECELTGSVPEDLFAPLSMVTELDCSNMFYRCWLEGSVPVDIFAGMPLLTSLDCSHLFSVGGNYSGSVPDGLFRRQGNLTSLNCAYLFSGQYQLSGSVPTGVFTGCKKLVNLDCSAMFNNCNGLSGSVPEGLFRGIWDGSKKVSLRCPLMFSSNNWVKAAPGSGFLGGVNQAGGCEKLDLHHLFSGCRNLTGNATGGWWSSGKGYSFTRFMNGMYSETGVTGIASNLLDGVPTESESVGGGLFTPCMTQMFYNCTELRGNVPSFWETYAGLGMYTCGGFYEGCVNAKNYASIPDMWKKYL